MEEENCLDICTPPEIKDSANEAIANLLPEKSKARYESTYRKFLEWCKRHKVKKYSENCLLAYFQQYESKKSLWSIYSMLKLCLMVNDSVNITNYSRLIAFLKRSTEHNKPKKSAVLEEAHILKFLEGAPNCSYLMMKVALILGICGALRREELCKMKPGDIEFRNDVVVVSIPETKTGNPRSFAVTDPKWIDTLKRYNSIRKPNNQRFFITYTNGKCINTPVGINTIGKIPMKVAEFLKLAEPWTYTGHCFRRSSATLLANHGEGLIGIKQLGGWKSSKVAESYIQDSLHNKIELSKKVQPTRTVHTATKTPSSSTILSVQGSKTTSMITEQHIQQVPEVEIKECKDCAINVRIFNNCTFPSVSP